MHPRRVHWTGFGLAAVLAGAVAWTYAATVHHGFVMFDDDINLYLNPWLRAPAPASLWWMFTNASRMLRYLPLGWLGFASIFAGWGLNPSGYHLANLGLHAVNAVLAFAVFARLVPRGRVESGNGDVTWRLFAAASGAALWALHPLRVEAVAWASGQLYLQATAWALASTLAFQSALERREMGRPWAAWLAASAAACAASLLAYPLAFGLPVALASLAAWHDDRHSGAAGRRSPAWLAAPHAALAAASLVATVLIRVDQSGLWNPAAPASGFGLASRLAQAAYVAARSLSLTLVPVGLTPADDILEHFSPVSPLFIGCFALMAAVTIASWRLRHRQPGMGWLWLAYLGLLAPFLGLLEHPYYPCDRYTYLPGLVLGAGAAAGLGRLRARRLRTLAIPLLVATGLLLARASERQAVYWKDTDTLFARIEAEARGATLRTRFQARQAWHEALVGREAEAEDLMAALKSRDPGNPELAEIQRRIDGLRPANPAAYVGTCPLARELQRMALEDAKSGRLLDAQQRLRRALALSPRFPEARFNLAIILAQRHRPLEAIQYLLTATAPGSNLAVAAPRLKAALNLIAGSFEQSGETRWSRVCKRAADRLP